MPFEYDVEVTNNTIRLWREKLKRATEDNHEGKQNCARLHIKIYQGVREHHGFDPLPEDE